MTDPIDGGPRAGSRRAERLPAALALARRLGWGFGDQAISSLTNFALGILIARSVSTEDFGAFSIALVTYWTALGIVRGATSQPLVIRYAAVPIAEWRSGAAAAIGTALLAGVAMGVVCVGVGTLLDGALREAFVALGILLPGLLVQDGWRFAFFAAGRGRSAFVNDLIWGAALLPAMFVVVASDHVAIFWAMMAWGMAALVASIAGIVQSGFVPQPLHARRWLRAHRDLAGRYVAEVVASLGLGQVATYAIAAIGGLATVGALRLGRLLVNPVYVVFQGIYLVGVPEGVRALEKSTQHLARYAAGVGLGLGGVVLIWSLVILLVPDDVGRQVLGEAWESGRSVFVPLAVGQAASGLISGALIGLRALAAAQRSLQTTIVSALTMLIASVGGVIVAGAQGVAWAGAIGATFYIAVWWSQFRRALAEHRGARATLAAKGTIGAELPGAGPEPF